MLLYPNPASDKINLQIASCINISKPLIANIYDVNGQVALQTTISNSNAQLNVKELPCGTYLLELNDGSQPFTYSFVVH